MKSDVFTMSMLFDFYGELLTDKQKELFDLYYNEDLSLSEISEHAGITRQGVRDAIMRAEDVLRDTEDKLGLIRRYGAVDEKLHEIYQATAYIAQVNATVLKNYEIAVRTDTILKSIQDIGVGHGV